MELLPGFDLTDEGVIRVLGEGAFLQLGRYDEDWFSRHPIPLVAGVTFGIAWLHLALVARRAAHSLVPPT